MGQLEAYNSHSPGFAQKGQARTSTMTLRSKFWCKCHSLNIDLGYTRAGQRGE